MPLNISAIYDPVRVPAWVGGKRRRILFCFIFFLNFDSSEGQSRSPAMSRKHEAQNRPYSRAGPHPVMGPGANPRAGKAPQPTAGPAMPAFHAFPTIKPTFQEPVVVTSSPPPLRPSSPCLFDLI